MSTTRLPELPEPYGYVVLGHHFSQSERSAKQSAWLCSMRTYESLPITKVYSEEQVRDLLRAAAIRSLPDPSATPQDQGGER